MILSNFLGARYTPEESLSLSASLTFEQSYGMVEGDSASTAELCALLSSLAQCPLHQSLAVTGSVNQHGEVQAIGGVNDKIEGFFDICSQRGLTGDQGVIIPQANTAHLMLREDVRQAAADGNFHIYSVTTVDEALSLLTGLEAGERGKDGRFPEGTVNRRVEDRLKALSRLHRKEKSQEDSGDDDG
jgi:predicted ATP-dependent protease